MTQRLVMIITGPLPDGITFKWLSDQPFLGKLVREGLWAELDIHGADSLEQTWSFLTEGTTAPQPGSRPLWEILEESGKKISVIGSPVSLPPQISKSRIEMPKLLSQGEWDLVINFQTPNTLDEGEMKQASDLDYWQKFDRDLEEIVKVEGDGPLIFILAVGDQDQTKSWIIAGGPNTASIGNPGPISILDIPSTILWLLDIDLPPGMDGRVMNEILDLDEDLTQDEIDLLTDHLRGLGYLG